MRKKYYAVVEQYPYRPSIINIMTNKKEAEAKARAVIRDWSDGQDEVYVAEVRPIKLYLPGGTSKEL